jgi:hypothetical protein
MRFGGAMRGRDRTKGMKEANGFTVRQASVDEAATIAHHRRAMFLEMGSACEAALDEMAVR